MIESKYFLCNIQKNLKILVIKIIILHYIEVKKYKKQTNTRQDRIDNV